MLEPNTELFEGAPELPNIFLFSFPNGLLAAEPKPELDVVAVEPTLRPPKPNDPVLELPENVLG